MPSELWQDSQYISKVIDDHLDYKKIVIHCQKSQVRGPTCARLFKDALKERNDVENKPEMYIFYTV